MLSGVVKSREPDGMYNVTVDNESCLECASNGHNCSAKDCTMRVLSKEPLNPGDRVSIDRDSKQAIFSSLLIFLFPLCVSFIAYFICNSIFKTQMISIIFSIAGLIASYLIVYQISKKHFNQYPEATKIDE